MKILVIGDIVGENAVKMLENKLQSLKTKYNIEIAHINRQIHATVADPYLSDLLGIMENAPLLYITTVAYNQNDIPFEYSLASYRADMYKMNVDLYKDKYYK